jgi:hypothetical protein
MNRLDEIELDVASRLCTGKICPEYGGVQKELKREPSETVRATRVLHFSQDFMRSSSHAMSFLFSLYIETSLSVNCIEIVDQRCCMVDVYP